MSEKSPVKQKELPKHEEMFLDQSLYDLHVEEIRQEGAKRERKGVMTAINRFFKTPAGEKLGTAIFATGLASNGMVTGSIIERLSRQQLREDIYDISETRSAPDSFAGDRSLEKVRDELTSWLGREEVSELIPVVREDRDRAGRERRRKEIRHEEVAEVEGFDSLGISHETVERYLEEGFPRFMTSRENLASIEFTREHRNIRADYHLDEGTEVAGTCSVAAGPEASEITIYGSMLDDHGRLRVAETFNEVMIHELMHGIDWTNLEAVDPATRTRMLHQMVSHVRDDRRRLFFSYVEDIDNEDSHVQLRNRTVEYYAEFASAVFRISMTPEAQDSDMEEVIVASLVSQYANRPEMSDEEIEVLSRAVRDDMRLVHAIVQVYEPDFNWTDAGVARNRAVSDMVMEIRYTELRQAVGHIPAGPARQAVSEAIERMFERSAAERIAEGPSESEDQRFIRLAGSGERVTYEYSTLTPVEYMRDGRSLEQRVQQVQEAQFRELESHVSPEDMPAYRALAGILEQLEGFHPVSANDASVDALRGMIVEYGRLARHASDWHVEMARDHLGILQGHRGISRELLREIQAHVRSYSFG